MGLTQAIKYLVGPVFVTKLRCVRLARFKLDGHGLIAQQIHT